MQEPPPAGVSVSERYTRGQVCDLTGHDRTVSVHYICSHSGNVFHSIEELLSCQYMAVVGTPELCKLGNIKEVSRPRGTQCRACLIPHCLCLTCNVFCDLAFLIFGMGSPDLFIADWGTIQSVSIKERVALKLGVAGSGTQLWDGCAPEACCPSVATLVELLIRSF